MGFGGAGSVGSVGSVGSGTDRLVLAVCTRNLVQSKELNLVGKLEGP